MDLSTQAIQKALKNQWREAASLNELLLSQFPDNIAAMNRLAQAYIQLGKFAKAKNIYFQVLKSDRFNPIAKRNLTKIKNLPNNGNFSFDSETFQPSTFIEEPGKTKVVGLVRVGEASVISQLQPCACIKLHFKTHSICLYYKNQYVGRLPDDIARRLIWLCSRNNEYKAYVKLVEKNKIKVFIKELKRSAINKNYSSFLEPA